MVFELSSIFLQNNFIAICQQFVLKLNFALKEWDVDDFWTMEDDFVILEFLQTSKTFPIDYTKLADGKFWFNFVDVTHQIMLINLNINIDRFTHVLVTQNLLYFHFALKRLSINSAIPPIIISHIYSSHNVLVCFQFTSRWWTISSFNPKPSLFSHIYSSHTRLVCFQFTSRR